MDLSNLFASGFVSFPSILIENKDKLNLSEEDLGRLLIDLMNGERSQTLSLLSKVIEYSSTESDNKAVGPMSEVFEETEKMLGRLLSPIEIQKIITWNQDYLFYPEAILILITYCLHRGKTHINYLDAVAKNWYNRGVRTGLEAQKEIEGLKDRRQKYDNISKLLRLNRQLTAHEEELYDKWMDDWGLDEKIIVEGCKELINISQPSFKYLDKVLEDWSNKGINSAEEARNTSKSRKKKTTTKKKTTFNNFPEREYNDDYFKELEKKLTGLGKQRGD